MKALLLLALVCGTFANRAAAAPLSPVDEALQHIHPHPRLIMADERLDQLKKLAATDALLAKAVQAVLAEADQDLLKPVPTAAGGVAAWGTPGKLRVYTLGFAYRWTGDVKYAQKVEQDLLAVAAFHDWKGSFLMTAETSHSLGIGYDWCFKGLSDDAKAKIRAGLLANGMAPYLQAVAHKEWWTDNAFNWNQVCNGGTLLGALAIADEEPGRAGRVVRQAVAALPRALHSYDQDGLWPEGLDYWTYATEYTVWALAGLESSLGTDFGLSDPKQYPGLSRAAMAVVWGAGPFRQFVNFADTQENKKRWDLPSLFWLGRRFDLPAAIAAETYAMANYPSVLDVVWYVPSQPAAPPPPLDKQFRGSVELATFRSAWDDPQALFASLKAGYNEVNHGHLDLGVFEIDALGVRWARDLGRDSYGLPGYFDDRGPGGKAWNVYRLRSVSHSVPLIDGQDQPLSAKAKLTAFQGDWRGSPASPAFAVVDLGAAYPACKSAARGLAMVANRRAVLVQDEFELAAGHEVTWAMTTDAAIEVAGAEATLSLKAGTWNNAPTRRMKAHILSPPGAVFTSESAEQLAPQAANKGVSRLLVRLPGATGSVRIAVLLTPVWPDEQAVAAPALMPLKEWGTQGRVLSK